MGHILLRIVIAALLVIHGVAHVEITRVWGARESATSWLFGEADRLGTVLSMVALAGFVLAGLAVFLGLGAWRPLAVAAACVSLLTIALFWDWKMALGVAVNAGILFALIWGEVAGTRPLRLLADSAPRVPASELAPRRVRMGGLPMPAMRGSRRLSSTPKSREAIREGACARRFVESAGSFVLQPNAVEAHRERGRRASTRDRRGPIPEEMQRIEENAVVQFSVERELEGLDELAG